MPHSQTIPTTQPVSYPEAERSILAALMLRPDLLPKIREVLPTAEMFHTNLYRRVYAAALSADDQGKLPDYLTILATDATLSAAEVSGLVVEALDILPPSFLHDPTLRQQQIETHAALIKEAYARRETQLALQRGESAEAVLSRLATLSKRGADKFYDADELASLVFSEMSERRGKTPYPYRLLQECSDGGIRSDELIIVAGRPGAGKSAMLQNMAWHAATCGKRVLFASAEMSAASIGLRLVSSLSGQGLMQFTGMTDRDRVMEALKTLAEQHLYLYELSNVAQLEEKLKEYQGQIDIVFVDYLQKMQPKARGKSTYETVSAISHELDDLSHRYDVPFVVACQFNRAADRSQPTMADLRDSGQIEADADVIISLWEKKEDRQDARRSKVYIDVLKNRNGYTVQNTQTHEYALWFNKPIFTFSDLDHRRV